MYNIEATIHGTFQRGIREALIRDKNLILVLTDGQEVVLGKVVGEDGANGMSLVLANAYEEGDSTVLVIRDAIKDTTLTLPHGKSAYQVAQGQGFGGTEMQWLKSLIGPKGEDGTSPTWTVEDIEGGHRVTITDKDGTKSFDVMDGKDGQGGGTGGTSDYNQISNKPRINGHTLTADSTAQDLGLATNEQIPDVDTTLTQSGAAADAKTVGDKLAAKQGKSDDFRVAPGKALFFDNDSSGSYLLDESVSPQMPVIAFYGDSGDDPVILRYIATPQQSGDAANKSYVDTEISKAVGSIDSLLATMVATYEEVLR